MQVELGVCEWTHLETLRPMLNRAITETLIDRPPLEFEVPRRNHELPVARDEQEQPHPDLRRRPALATLALRTSDQPTSPR